MRAVLQRAGGVVAGIVLGAVVASGLGIAGAATGQNFLLGRSNTAASVSSLRSGSGTPLSLRAPTGHAPLAVNSSTEVKQLNAAMVGGLSARQLQRRVTGHCPAGVSAISGGRLVCTAAAEVIRVSSTWTAPAGVHSVVVDAVGGGGGGGYGARGRAGGGGEGAEVVSRIDVSPGEALDVVIGRPGRAGTGSASATGGAATVVYRRSSDGALLVKAGGGTGGRGGDSSLCASGTGGRAAAPTSDGVLSIRGEPGGVGSCRSGGGSAGFPGAGGAPSRGGGGGQPGSAGIVTITVS